MIEFQQFSTDLRVAIRAAQTAGEAILPLFRSDKLDAKIKADQSDVTAADYRSNDIIIATLRAFDPQTPVLSEETQNEFSQIHPIMPSTCWIIDPLDGTSIFKAGMTGFLVMIAKMKNHQPQVAVCHHPYTNETYFAEKGMGAFKINAHGEIRKLWREPINQDSQLRITTLDLYDDPVSVEIAKAFAKNSGFTKPVEIAHSHDAPHFMLSVASGETDFAFQYLNEKYRALGTGAGLWDHAPRELILKEANCVYTDHRGHPFVYKDPNFVSQMFLILAPGLDQGIMVRTVAEQLSLHGLPEPLN